MYFFPNEKCFGDSSLERGGCRIGAFSGKSRASDFACVRGNFFPGGDTSVRFRAKLLATVCRVPSLFLVVSFSEGGASGYNFQGASGYNF